MHGCDRKGMPQHRRRHGPTHPRTIGHPREDALERMRRHPNGVMDRAMMFDERFDPRGTRENTALGLAALQTGIAIHHETMAMPVTMLLCEASL